MGRGGGVGGHCIGIEAAEAIPLSDIRFADDNPTPHPTFIAQPQKDLERHE